MVLLNDCSVLLNLLAGDCLAELQTSTGWKLAICPAVRNEAIKLRDPQSGELAPLDLEPLFSQNLIEVLELSGQAEQKLYVELSIVVDDGEAMSIAIAGKRGLDLAIDDKKAIRHAAEAFPGMRIWTTPELLKHWCETSTVSEERMSRVIQLIKARANYFPHKSHPLADWWKAKGLYSR